jgi:hypothetical protein
MASEMGNLGNRDRGGVSELEKRGNYRESITPDLMIGIDLK